MSLDLASGPDRTRDAASPAGLSPDLTQPQSGALTDAVARLSPQERAGFDSLRSTMDGHFAAIRSGAAPPPGFAAAVGSYNQVLGSLGLPGVDSRDGQAMLAQATPSRAGAAVGALAGQARQQEQGRQQGPERVAQALGTVREALSERVLDPDVSRADLGRVENAIRGLSREDATAVVRSLSNSELTHWTSEIDGTRGGYTRADRGTLFNVLAARLDTAQLTRFADALGTPGSDGARGQQFGQAVAAHTPEGTRAAFVREASRYSGRDAEIGPAVGEALASLRGAALDRTLGALQQSGRLAGVVEGSVRSDLTTSPEGNGGVLSYDADTLGRVLRTVAASGNDTARAAAVNAASGQLADVEQGASFPIATLRGDSVNQIRGGITTVLRRDTAGTLDALERTNRGGGAFPDYVASMIRSGQSAEVGQMLVRVGTGNGTAQAAAWVTQQSRGDGDGRPYYNNAQTLGFAVGSVAAAIESISDSRKAQGDMVKNIFGAAAGAAGATSGPAGAVASVLTGAVNIGVDSVVSSYVRDGNDLKTALTALAFPRNPDGSPYNGGAEPDYDSTMLRVVDSQRTRR